MLKPFSPPNFFLYSPQKWQANEDYKKLYTKKNFRTVLPDLKVNVCKDECILAANGRANSWVL